MTSHISKLVRPTFPPHFFAIDLDGTFYTGDEESFNKNLLAFAKVRKLGYNLFFCTARTYCSAMYLFPEDLVEKTGYNGYPGIYSNGATVYDENGEVIRYLCFSPEILRHICNYLEEKNMLNRAIFFTSTGSHRLCDLLPEVINITTRDKLPTGTIITLDSILKKEIVTFSMFLINNLSDIGIPDLKNNVDFVVKNSGEGYYDFTPPGATKATALELLMKHVDHPPESCGFVGDGENDIEVMMLSELSFAAGNAPDHVKKHAKYSLDLNTHEATVAKVLESVYDFTLDD